MTLPRLLEVLLSNAGSAAVLAMAAALASRFVRRPAIAHALWLVVLLKLLAPPILELGLLPTRTASALLLPAVATAGPNSAPLPIAAETAPALSGRQLLLGVWLLGATAALALAVLRTVRLGRLVARSERPAGDLRARVANLAPRLGVRKPPRVRVVDAPLPPLLWGVLSRVELVLPARLLDALKPDEADALLAHELAHLRRRDHWVRHLELLAVVVFWWYPVAWWARHRVRAAEELSCDALVARSLPGKARAYADGLVKTMTYLSCTRTPRLSSVSPAGGLGELKGRLAMIMSRKLPEPVTPVGRTLLALAAAAVLAIFPSLTPHTVAATPAAEGPDRPVTLYLADAPLLKVLQRVSTVTGATVVVHPRAAATGRLLDTVTLDAVDRPWEEVLEGLLAAHGLAATREGPVLWIHDPGFALEGDRTFTGEPITLHLVDAELRDALATFSSLTGLDIVLPDDVQGRVTVVLNEVPWDQALDVILRLNGLGYARHDGTVNVFRQTEGTGWQLGSPPPRPEPLQAASPDRPAEDEVFRFVHGGDITEPRPVYQLPPDYPEEARQARVQGVVLLEAVIGADGRVQDLEVLRDMPLGMTEAALAAARQWRYEPATLDGQPVAVKLIVAVRFNLDDDKPGPS